MHNKEKLKWLNLMRYCKAEKLSGRKVSRFEMICENVEKTFFHDFASIVISMARRLSISRENFCDSSKICKKCKSFLLLNFWCLRYVKHQDDDEHDSSNAVFKNY